MGVNNVFGSESELNWDCVLTGLKPWRKDGMEDPQRCFHKQEKRQTDHWVCAPTDIFTCSEHEVAFALSDFKICCLYRNELKFTNLLLVLINLKLWLVETWVKTVYFNILVFWFPFSPRMKWLQLQMNVSDFSSLTYEALSNHSLTHSLTRSLTHSLTH